jgi:DNA-binding transcriptional ArsR family regulator
MVDLDVLLQGLKAAGEPTRLRILAMLAGGELTVSEIADVLGQSQPRVSRHLKVLCDAGLLDRFREQHWVYYRVTARGPVTDLVKCLLELLPTGDATLVLDHERVERLIDARLAAASAEAADSSLPAAVESPLGELAPVVETELGAAGLGELLDVGTGEGHLLRLLGPRATHALGIDISTGALRAARRRLHIAGLGHCEVRRGDMYQLSQPDSSCDTVTMDRVLADAERPGAAIAEAARVLRGGGRLLVIEDYEQLATAARANPLNTLRAWLLDAGLECQRLRPVDTTAGLQLVAIAGRRAAAAIAA